MDTKYKINYEPPKVTSVAFKVEVGQAASRVHFDQLIPNTFDDNSWDGPSSGTSTNHFGNGDWTGGTSFSNNSTFGSGHWD